MGGRAKSGKLGKLRCAGRSTGGAPGLAVEEGIDGVKPAGRSIEKLKLGKLRWAGSGLSLGAGASGLGARWAGSGPSLGAGASGLAEALKSDGKAGRSKPP